MFQQILMILHDGFPQSFYNTNMNEGQATLTCKYDTIYPPADSEKLKFFALYKDEKYYKS